MENTSVTKVYVVLVGQLNDSPEGVQVLGVYLTEKAAFEARNADYIATNYIDDEDLEAGVGPDLSARFVDDGAMFWSIETSTLEQ